MPEYLYQHPKTEEVKSVFQSVHDKHEYIDKDGIKWNRIYTVPQMGVDTKMDASMNSKKFAEMTGNKKGTLGDLYDQSKELSEARKKVYGGKDPVKQKYWENWSKTRKGKKHPKMFED
jgi:hypothetical protein